MGADSINKLDWSNKAPAETSAFDADLAAHLRSEVWTPDRPQLLAKGAAKNNSASESATAGDSPTVTDAPEKLNAAEGDGLEPWLDYGVSFAKNVSLFLPKGYGIIASSIIYSLAEIHRGDSPTQIAEDMSLGAIKGLAMRTAFEKLTTAKLNPALSGVAIGTFQRGLEMGLTRNTYIDQSGRLDLAGGVKNTLETSLDWRAMATDAAVWSVGGIASNRIGKSISSARPLFKTLVTGATFGAASGASGELVKETRTGQGIEPGEIVKQALINGALTGVAALPGGYISYKSSARESVPESVPAIERVGSTPLERIKSGTASSDTSNAPKNNERLIPVELPTPAKNAVETLPAAHELKSNSKPALRPGPILAWAPESEDGIIAQRPVENGVELEHITGLKITRQHDGTEISECPISGFKTKSTPDGTSEIITRNGSVIRRQLLRDAGSEYYAFDLVKEAPGEHVEVTKNDIMDEVTVTDPDGTQMHLAMERINVLLPDGTRTSISNGYKRWTVQEPNSLIYTNSLVGDTYLTVRSTDGSGTYGVETRTNDNATTQAKPALDEKLERGAKARLEYYRNRLIRRGLDPVDIQLSNLEEANDFIDVMYQTFEKLKPNNEENLDENLAILGGGILKFARSKNLPVTDIDFYDREAEGTYENESGKMWVNRNYLLKPQTDAAARQLIKTIYHELTHAEQNKLTILRVADQLQEQNAAEPVSANEVSNKLFKTANINLLHTDKWNLSLVEKVLSTREAPLSNAQANRADIIMQDLQSGGAMNSRAYFSSAREREAWYIGELIESALKDQANVAVGSFDLSSLSHLSTPASSDKRAARK